MYIKLPEFLYQMETLEYVKQHYPGLNVSRMEEFDGQQTTEGSTRQVQEEVQAQGYTAEGGQEQGDSVGSDR